MLTRADIDQIAAYKRKLPDKVSTGELVYYFCIDHLYRDYEAKKFDKRTATKRKNEITDYFDRLESMSQSNAKIICELSKLTAPRSELAKRSKDELLEIIARIEALVTGIIKEHGEKLPEFITFKAVDG